MGTKKLLLLKAHFDLLHTHLFNRVMFGNMVGVVGSIWVFIWSCVYFVIGFITRYLFRSDQIDSCKDIVVFGETEVDFHVQNGPKDHDHESREERQENSKVLESFSAITSTNKYEFFYSKDINGYLEEPKALSFTIQELYLGSDEFSTATPDYQIQEVSSEDDFLSTNSESETEEEMKPEKGLSEGESSSTEEVLEKHEEEEEEEENCPETELSEMDNYDYFLKNDSFLSKHSFCEDVELFSENYSPPSSDAKPVPNSISVGVSLREEETSFIHSSIIYEFEDLKPENNVQAIDENDKKKVENVEEFPIEEHTNFDEEEYIELELDNAKRSPSDSEEYSGKVEDDYEETEEEEEEEEEEHDNCEGNKLELAWEHEDIIEQLKWELKNARTGGLPTIFEEESDSESLPKEDHDHANLNLKSMKIDLKFGYKDRIEEIQIVYKMYAENMRKLDILNNQTMHAIGFLQLKDQFKSVPVQKPSVPIVKSLLPRKTRKEADSIRKLQNDFELVYAGQACLSWEILHWQHRKIQDLLQNDDAQGSHYYNLVASEFQLFQVLLQRFIEDESFQGPRVQNYVKNRCVIRSLMQVPVIKDDCVKNRQYLMEGKEDAILCESMEKIIVEAMFTFWEFLRKDEKSNNLKVAQQTLTDPADSKLLVDIKKDFQKKDRKVKDIQRSGNCVVKKLQKHQGGPVRHALFLAQVDLRLVSRVLSMSRLNRDQLIWCQQKLNQISFLNKKVHMETSFLLFPC